MADKKYKYITHIIRGKTPWEAYQAAAWKPRGRMKVSEWTANNRVLDAKNSAEPGRWKNSRTPYMIEVMDTFGNKRIEEITFMGSTQVSKTETMFNMMGYTVDQDPGPLMYVKAREDDTFSDAHNRLRPMFTESEVLIDHVPGQAPEKLTQKEFRLIPCTFYFAGSNSPAALASKPVRYLFLDETDKYPRFSGREASPIKLARHRTRTYWNRKIVKISTPTTKEGYIHQEYLKSDQRRYYVPCPHCGHYQILLFHNIKIPKDEREPGRIRELRIAWYECEKCKKKIRDHHKHGMLNRGKWVGDGQKINTLGELVGERKTGKHAGFWVNALYSPWLTFSEIIAEFLEAKDDDADLMDFKNSWLAEIWEEKAEYKESDQVLANTADYTPGEVPEGAVVLTAGIDVQKYYVYYVIRAWGANLRSWLIDEGELDSEPEDGLDAVKENIMGKQFNQGENGNGRKLGIALANIDSGYRTSEVYGFVSLYPRTRAVKGASRKPIRPYVSNIIDVHPVTGQRLKRGVRVWTLDTEFFKDFIFRRMGLDPDHERGWHVHGDITLDYADQITSEHKITVRRGRSEWEEWQPKTKGAKNHLWDCEVYAAAAAHMLKHNINVLVKQLESQPPGARPDPGQAGQNENWVTRRVQASGGGSWINRGN